MKILAGLIFFCICLCMCSAANAQLTQQKFYISRHAEKDTGNDPRISLKGQGRAASLYALLKDSSINSVFVTKYRRSLMTADSLLFYKKVPVYVYSADTTGDGFLKSFNEHAATQNAMLIIGHSNTVPAIIRSLGVADFGAKDLPDSQYDKIYVVTKNGAKAKLVILNYGEMSTGPAATMKLN